jgi:class 3 adenylate cyclase
VIEPAPDREALQALLRQYNEKPDQRPRIVDEINAQFSRELGILVLDSSGFTRTTRASGVIHFLALLERLERVVRPIVEHGGGRILKAEADNIFAIFPTATATLESAVEILRSLQAVNEFLSAAEEIYVAMGVGYGSVLLVGADDLYGDEMNVACKLGEDLAQCDEILITPSAFAQLDADRFDLEEVAYTISGLRLDAHRMRL